MKICPQCKSAFSDDTLLYCLSDGTPLLSEFEAEKFDQAAKTEQFPVSLVTREAVRPKVSEPSTPAPTENYSRTTTRQNSGRGWIFATFFLLGLLIIGGGVAAWAFLLKNGNAGENPSSQGNQTSFNGEIRNPSPENNAPGRTPEPTPDSPTYRVVGVKSNDVLYIRPAPNDLKTHLGQIPPDGTGIIITGPGKKAGSGIWYPIDYRGIRGWVHSRYIKKEQNP
ncbi:MAG: SH3 domain-containing protein [Pyrinomonadaceae bacterium]